MKKIYLVICLCMVANAHAQTIKKIVIDDVTGAWCPNCPIGVLNINTIHDANESTVFPVAIHRGDDLDMGFAFYMNNTMGIIGVPSAFVDRHFFPGLGDTRYTTTLVGLDQFGVISGYNERKTATAIASVGIANASFNATTDTWTGDIKIVFNAAPVANLPMTVNVLVLEDSIAATGTLVQKNNNSSIEGGASPLQHWQHNHVLRLMSNGAWGDTAVFPTSGPVIGTTYTKHASMTIPSDYVKKNVKLLAYVAYDGSNPVNNEKEILNAEEVGLLSSPAAINNVQNNNATFVKVYPSPVSNDGTVNIEFNLNENAKVILDVYNMLGQKVATPYVSEDVKGMHTIQWIPSQQNLSKGTYILQLATANGDVQTQRISIL